MATEATSVPADPPPVVIDGTTPAAPAAAAAAPAAPDPNAPPADEFSDMFTQFSRDEPETPVVPKPAVVAVETPEQAAAATAAAAAAAEAAKTTPAAPAAAPAAGDDPVARLAELLGERITAQPPNAQTQDRGPPQPPAFAPEEAQALQAFYTEWPEIARAQELVVRNAVRQTADHVFKEVARVMGPRMAMLERLADNQQFDYLDRRIPDYTTIQDKVAAWVGTQPDYLREAYTSVMDRGTPEQVENLIGRFRQETGTAAPAIAQPGGAAPSLVDPNAGLSPAAKKAVVALAPVTSKRTGPTAVAPTTFDDAFAEYAKVG